MTREYYYFAASLPMVNFDSHPPFSVDEFLENCQRLLVHEDYLAMREALVESCEASSCKSSTFRTVQEFYRQFTNIITVYRAGRANKDALDFIKGDLVSNAQLNEIVQQAAKQDNLYEAEKIIDQAKWNYLDGILSGHYYDFSFLLVYGLKLKILERYELLRSTKGSEIYQEIKKIDLSNIELRNNAV